MHNALVQCILSSVYCIINVYVIIHRWLLMIKYIFDRCILLGTIITLYYNITVLYVLMSQYRITHFGLLNLAIPTNNNTIMIIENSWVPVSTVIIIYTNVIIGGETYLGLGPQGLRRCKRVAPSHPLLLPVVCSTTTLRSAL